MSKTGRGILGLVCVALGLTACEVFEDQTPEFIHFRMSGTVGETVTVIYSKQFVAGVNESGVTRIQVFGADTVLHTLPIDTIIDVRLEQRIFLQARGSESDTVYVDVKVDVNDRGLYDRDGGLFPGIPWYFLYQFNQRFTDDVEIVI